MKRLLVILTVAMLVFTGCGSSSKDAAMEESGGSNPSVPMDEQMDNDMDMGGEINSATQDTGLPDGQRKIILNAEVSLKVEDIEGVSQKIKDKTGELKGYLSEYAVNVNEYNAYADISLKIPSPKYQEMLDFVAKQGKPDFLREYTNDVTSQYIDLDARVKVLKAEEDSLLGLLDQAKSMEDILKIRDQITSTRQERESLEGQFKALSHNVEYATINISLYKPRNSDANLNVENLNVFSRSLSGLIYGVNSLMAKLGNVVVWFFTVLPTLILIALVVVVLVYLRRWRRKKDKIDQ